MFIVSYSRIALGLLQVWIGLRIALAVPTFAPTISFPPTGNPTISVAPTISTAPTFDPTISFPPTTTPSFSPTISSIPTNHPTIRPTAMPNILSNSVEVITDGSIELVMNNVTLLLNFNVSLAGGQVFCYNINTVYYYHAAIVPHVKVSFLSRSGEVTSMPADLEIMFVHTIPSAAASTSYIEFFGGNDEFNIGDVQLGNWPDAFFNTTHSLVDQCRSFTWKPANMFQSITPRFEQICLANTCSYNTSYCVDDMLVVGQLELYGFNTTSKITNDTVNPVCAGYCSAGYYVHDVEASVCIACDGGYYTPSLNQQDSCDTCDLGYFSRPASSSCSLCPAGQYGNSSGLPQCDLCDAGYFQPLEGQIACDVCPSGSFCPEGSPSSNLCPISTYQSKQGSDECTACPTGSINGVLGSVTSSDCIIPVTNFAMGFVSVVLCGILLGPYIAGNRLRRIAFLRRERLVKQCQVLFSYLFDTLKILEKASQEIINNRHREALASTARYSKEFLKKLLFVTCIVVLVAGVIIYHLFFNLVMIIFKAMIVWRGYRDIIYFQVPNFSHLINQFIESIGLVINFPDITYIFYPVFRAISFIANININLSAVNVSCSGAQAPIRLLVDCLVAAFVVIVIESEMAVLWFCGVTNACQTFLKMIFNRYIMYRDKVVNKQMLFFMVWALAMNIAPSPLKLVQYAIGFVSVSYLFSEGGRAYFSANCDTISNLDSVLAFAATILGYMMVFPIFYLFSQVLVPSFDVSFKGKMGLKEEIQDDPLQRESMPHPGRIFNESDEEISIPTVAMIIVPDVEISSSSSPNDEQLVNGMAEKPSSTHRLSEHRLHRSIYTPYKNIYSIFQIISFPFAYDWIYVRFSYVFGYYLFSMTIRFLQSIPTNQTDKLNQILVDMGSENYVTELQKKFLKTYPLHNFFQQTAKFKEIKIRLYEKFLWLEEQANYPSYFNLILTVNEDYETNQIFGPFDKESKSGNIIYYILNILSGHIFGIFNILIDCTPISHWRSHRGVEIWKKVILNYFTYILASLGIWTDYVESQYQLVEKYKRYLQMIDKYNNQDIHKVSEHVPLPSKEEDSKATSSIRSYPPSFHPHNRSFNRSRSSRLFRSNQSHRSNRSNRSYHQLAEDPAKSVTSHEDDLKSHQEEVFQAQDEQDFINFLSGVVGTRVVLLQLLPFLTGISIFAVDFASSPIFVFNKDLVELLPPFIISIREAKRRAIVILKEQLNLDDYDDEEITRILPTWKIVFIMIYVIVYQSRFFQFATKFFFNFIAVAAVINTKKLYGIISATTFVLILLGSVQALYAITLLHKLFFPQMENREVSDSHRSNINRETNVPEDTQRIDVEAILEANSTKNDPSITVESTLSTSNIADESKI